MTISIRAEIAAGTTKFRAAQVIADTATRLGTAVRANFNGVDMTAEPGELPSAVLDRFDGDWKFFADAEAERRKRERRWGLGMWS